MIAAFSYLVLMVQATPPLHTFCGLILLSDKEVFKVNIFIYLYIFSRLFCLAIFLQTFLTKTRKHFVREKILFVNVFFKHVTKTQFKRTWFREIIPHYPVIVVPYADKENALSVLRYAKILRIEDLGKVLIT